MTVDEPHGCVYIVATPIGNLEDFSPRGQRVLREVGPRIRGLRSDPQVRQLIEDPEVAALIQSGDTLALIRHPGFQRVVSRVMADGSSEL